MPCTMESGVHHSLLAINLHTHLISDGKAACKICITQCALAINCNRFLLQVSCILSNMLNVITAFRFLNMRDLKYCTTSIDTADHSTVCRLTTYVGREMEQQYASVVQYFIWQGKRGNQYSLQLIATVV